MDKPIESFKKRLLQAMDIRIMKPVELAEKCNISKSTVSHYMSGYAEPKSNRLYTIANVLDVSETWLMGYDVPMGRNSGEDPHILKRDAILEDIENILETSNYTLSCETYDDDYFTIKGAYNQTLAGFYDYELLARYESLKKKGKVTAELLLSSESAFFKYLESLGYYVSRDDSEHKPFIHYGNGAVRMNSETLNDIRTKIDVYAKATVESAVLKLHESELRKERIEKEKIVQHLQGENICKGSRFDTDRKSYLEVNAAHGDSESTESERAAGDNIMKDDSEWG